MQRHAVASLTRLVPEAWAWTVGQRLQASTVNVPAGHHNSDLSSAACNIGLSRRRDITLRQDLKPYVDGKPASLADVFKGISAILIGLPDCGRVCKEQHLPGFIKHMDKVRDAGFDNVIIASVTSPDKLSTFMEDTGASTAGMRGLADESGAFTRMLGLDINAAGTEPPYSQRYIAFVQDGILARICIEQDPGTVKKADINVALDIISSLFK